MATLEHVLILVWHRPPELEDFDTVEHLTEDVVALHGKVIVMIIVEATHARQPSPEVRRRNADLVSRFSDTMLAMARVIEGDSLAQSAVRFVLSTIELMSPMTKVPQRTFDRVGGALGWLDTVVPGTSELPLFAGVKTLRQTAATRLMARRTQA